MKLLGSKEGRTRAVTDRTWFWCKCVWAKCISIYASELCLFNWPVIRLKKIHRSYVWSENWWKRVWIRTSQVLWATTTLLVFEHQVPSSQQTQKKEKIWWLDQESCHHFVGVWQNAVAPVVGFGVTKGRQWTRAHTRGSPLSKTKQPNLQYWSWVDWCCKVKSNGSATQKIHLVLGSVALFTAWAPDKSIDATFQHVFNEKAVFSIFGAKNSVFYIS